MAYYTEDQIKEVRSMQCHDVYIHGEPWDTGSSIELVYDPELIKAATENAKLIELPENGYVLLSEEDVEKEVATSQLSAVKKEA